jgi:N-acetylmuramoyl-L-alanine amidase
MEKEKNSRMVDLIVIHCSATKETSRLTPLALDRMHRQRGFNGCGYHYYIERDGKINSMRPSEKVGAHARGYNAHSLGICYEGGLDKNGRAADTRTERQKVSLRALVKVLRQLYPTINRVVGHRDLSADRNGDGVITPDEWTKQCPCFDVVSEL